MRSIQTLIGKLEALEPHNGGMDMTGKVQLLSMSSTDGFFFQVFLEKFSRGVEHGHLHVHGKPSKLIPYEILISLSLHSFMEGMPLGSGLLGDERSQLSFLFGIVSHEMPAAFAMVSILKASNLKPHLLRWFIVVYASMSAMGAGISSLLKYSVDEHVFEYLMAFVVGTFLRCDCHLFELWFCGRFICAGFKY